MNQPIASYRESGFPRKQSTRLYPDRLHVQGSVFLSQDYDVVIQLSQLSDIVNRSHGRSQLFQAGIFLSIITTIVALSMISIPHSYEHSFLTRLLFSLPFVGIILAIVTARKIEMAHFTATQGFVLLSICRRGPDQEHFEDFIEQVIQSIRKTQQSTPPNSSGGTPSQSPS
jgi:hypothetical protein